MRRTIAICVLGAVIATAALAACGSGGERPLVVHGPIDDRSIELERSIAPRDVRFELKNAGSTPCDLVMIVTSELTSIPTDGGRLDAAAIGAGSSIDVIDSAVAPGTIVIFSPMERPPPGSSRILLCNGPGDIEAGRWATLATEP